MVYSGGQKHSTRTAQQYSRAPQCSRVQNYSSTVGYNKAHQRIAAQYTTAQHSTARTAQHSTAQHSTAQHSTAQHSTAQHSAAQRSTAQHSTAQHSRDDQQQRQSTAAEQGGESSCWEHDATTINIVHARKFQLFCKLKTFRTRAYSDMRQLTALVGGCLLPVLVLGGDSHY